MVTVWNGASIAAIQQQNAVAQQALASKKITQDEYNRFMAYQAEQEKLARLANTTTPASYYTRGQIQAKANLDVTNPELAKSLPVGATVVSYDPVKQEVHYRTPEQEAAYQQSVVFYTDLGYPEYGGVYQPIAVPAGSKIESIKQTDAGLSVTFIQESLPPQLTTDPLEGALGANIPKPSPSEYTRPEPDFWDVGTKLNYLRDDIRNAFGIKPVMPAGVLQTMQEAKAISANPVGYIVDTVLTVGGLIAIGVNPAVGLSTAALGAALSEGLNYVFTGESLSPQELVKSGIQTAGFSAGATAILKGASTAVKVVDRSLIATGMRSEITPAFKDIFGYAVKATGLSKTVLWEGMKTEVAPVFTTAVQKVAPVAGRAGFMGGLAGGLAYIETGDIEEVKKNAVLGAGLSLGIDFIVPKVPQVAAAGKNLITKGVDAIDRSAIAINMRKEILPVFDEILGTSRLRSSELYLGMKNFVVPEISGLIRPPKAKTVNKGLPNDTGVKLKQNDAGAVDFGSDVKITKIGKTGQVSFSNENTSVLRDSLGNVHFKNDVTFSKGDLGKITFDNGKGNIKPVPKAKVAKTPLVFEEMPPIDYNTLPSALASELKRLKANQADPLYRLLFPKDAAKAAELKYGSAREVPEPVLPKANPKEAMSLFDALFPEQAEMRIIKNAEARYGSAVASKVAEIVKTPQQEYALRVDKWLARAAKANPLSDFATEFKMLKKNPQIETLREVTRNSHVYDEMKVPEIYPERYYAENVRKWIVRAAQFQAKKELIPDFDLQRSILQKQPKYTLKELMSDRNLYSNEALPYVYETAFQGISLKQQKWVIRAVKAGLPKNLFVGSSIPELPKTLDKYILGKAQRKPANVPAPSEVQMRTSSSGQVLLQVEKPVMKVKEVQQQQVKQAQTQKQRVKEKAKAQQMQPVAEVVGVMPAAYVHRVALDSFPSIKVPVKEKVSNNTKRSQLDILLDKALGRLTQQNKPKKARDVALASVILLGATLGGAKGKSGEKQPQTFMPMLDVAPAQAAAQKQKTAPDEAIKPIEIEMPKISPVPKQKQPEPIIEEFATGFISAQSLRLRTINVHTSEKPRRQDKKTVSRSTLRTKPRERIYLLGTINLLKGLPKRKANVKLKTKHKRGRG